MFVGRILGTPGSPSRTIYASNNGLFRSVDLGVTWTSLYITDSGLAQPPVKGFAVDPTNELVVYVTTTLAGGSCWKSTDGGNTWAHANSGLPSAGTDPTYFTLAMGNLYLQMGDRLYKSTDGAATWTLLGALPNAAGHLAVHSNMPSRMYYANGLRFYRSDDEGRTWQSLNSTILGDVPSTVYVESIGTIATNAAVVLAAINGPGAFFDTAGTYRSADSGAKFDKLAGIAEFVEIFSGLSGPVYASSSVTGGVCRSANEGAQWTCVSPPKNGSLLLQAVDPRSRTILYGDVGGPARSTDSGDTWRLLNGTVRPTLAKRTTPVTMTLEQGTVGSASFRVQVLEQSSWAIPFAVSTSGESWLSLDAALGTTPASINVTFSAVNLAPGTYKANIQVASPQSSNGAVSISVQLTVAPRNSSGRFFRIDTVAGNGLGKETRSTGSATSMAIGWPLALAMDASGNLYIASLDYRVWRYDGKGTVVAFAGTGVSGFSGNGGPATSANLDFPSGIAADNQGNVFLSEGSRIRRVTNGIIFPMLDGTNKWDDGVSLYGLNGLATDPQNRLFVAAGDRMGVYTGSSTLTRVMLRGVTLQQALRVASDASSRLYVADSKANQIFRIEANGQATVFAGTGAAGFGGDGGPATSALLSGPAGVAVDQDGYIYIADCGNQRVRMVSPGGNISTIAGTDAAGFSGDGGLAYLASLTACSDVAVDRDGSVYLADGFNRRVRKLTPLTSPPPFLDSLANAGSGGRLLSPGGVFVANGTNLAMANAAVTDGPWQLSLGGATLKINDISAPLSIAGASQLTGQVPYEVQAGPATAVVTVNGISSPPFSLTVIAAAPGILENGAHRAVAMNSDGSPNSDDNPALGGDTVTVSLYGIGPLDNPVATGAVAPGDPLSRPTLPYTVTIGDRAVDGVDITLSPGAVGLAQAIILVPDLPAGNYPVVISINGVASNAPLVSVTPAP
jgi:uncharacterized protein (TIGR03437 family)